jgi:hypothetical protein
MIHFGVAAVLNCLGGNDGNAMVKRDEETSVEICRKRAKKITMRMFIADSHERRSGLYSTCPFRYPALSQIM